jgi:ATPase subunit of ABC transporter with duplicated ATPase domains
LSALSPSQKARIQLISLLIRKVDVVVFDEPTSSSHGLNHDDVQDLQMFLKTRVADKLVILRSSDEDFLNAVSTSVLEIVEDGQSSVYHRMGYSYARDSSQKAVENRKKKVKGTALIPS